MKQIGEAICGTSGRFDVAVASVPKGPTPAGYVSLTGYPLRIIRSKSARTASASTATDHCSIAFMRMLTVTRLGTKPPCTSSRKSWSDLRTPRACLRDLWAELWSMRLFAIAVRLASDN